MIGSVLRSRISSNFITTLEVRHSCYSRSHTENLQTITMFAVQQLRSPAPKMLQRVGAASSSTSLLSTSSASSSSSMVIACDSVLIPRQVLDTGDSIFFSSSNHSLQQVRFRRGKRPKRPKRMEQSAEYLDMRKVNAEHGKTQITNMRLEDRIAHGAESPYQVSKAINKYLHKVTIDPKKSKEFHWRRSKDFTHRQKYRMLRFAGMTHDFQEQDPSQHVYTHEDTGAEVYVTPLEQMRRESTLPRTLQESRFTFPHLLSYRVYWAGVASPNQEPNEYNPDSMKSCSVTFDVKDLQLKTKEQNKLLEIVGQNNWVAADDDGPEASPEGENGFTSRTTRKGRGNVITTTELALRKIDDGLVEKSTGRVVSIESDYFPERNQNAAVLGDMVESLIRESKKGE